MGLEDAKRIEMHHVAEAINPRAFDLRRSFGGEACSCNRPTGKIGSHSHRSIDKITPMSQPFQKELSRHPEQSVTWVRVLENGDFEVEFYDYSRDENSPFGHDYAIKNIVKCTDVLQMKRLLGASSDLGNDEFLELVCQKFGGRPEVEEWCKANEVPCEHLYELA